MNKTWNRILAITAKEWRLNLRFPAEYFVTNLISPLKSAVVMIFLYSGIFKSTPQFLGSVTKENYVGYVLLGSILHGQLSTAIGVFSGKLVTEKYWQTALATLLSPASIYEVLVGFAIGSGGMSFLVNVLLLSLITLLYPIGPAAYLLSLLVLILVAILGFGLGLIGATVGLVWEGRSFAFHYGVQLIALLSCFYYPVDIMPGFLQPIIRVMPTYMLGDALHMLYLGSNSLNLYFAFSYMAVTCAMVLLFAGYLYNYSLRKYGLIGY